MKSKFILSLAALSLGSLVSHADEAVTTAPAAPAPAAAAPSVSVIATPTFVSQYMFRGMRLGGASFQPSIEADYGNLGLGVWTNFPMKDKVVGQSDPEIDPYGYYTFAISDSLSIVPGFTLYDYPKAKTGDGFFRSTFEPSIAVNYTVAGVKFTPKYYYDVVLKGPTYELTSTYAIPLKDLSTEIDLTGTVGTYLLKNSINNSNPDTKNWGDYWLIGAALPFAITKESKLTLGWAYTKGSNNYYKQGTAGKTANAGAVGRGVVTVSYAWTF